jgi:hypothetical protein
MQPVTIVDEIVVAEVIFLFPGNPASGAAAPTPEVPGR